MSWRHMKSVEVWFHAFLNSALDGSEQLTSHPGSFTPRKMQPLDKKLGRVQGQFMHGGQDLVWNGTSIGQSVA
jgi:hypothetical protein